MGEQVFLEEDGVKVTNARLIAKGRTFAIHAITSVNSGPDAGVLV